MTTLPGYGHFHPVAPLGLALQRAGHEVRVATHVGFGRWVEACGLTVLPAGRSEDEMVAEAAGLPPEERPVRLFTTISVPTFANDVLAAIKNWPPDLVLSEEGEHAGPLVASVLGVPSATHSWPAPARPPEERAARAEALEGVWREFGHQGPPRLYGDHYLDCCPPPLQTSAIETIEGVTAIRPTLFDAPPTTPPRGLEEVVPPVVFVTLSTVPMSARPDILRLIVDTVPTEPGCLIASTAPRPKPGSPPPPKGP